jgi:hypothetical protein
MNLIPAIHHALEQQPDEPRAYIGASSIGSPCERAIWYGLNQPENKVVTPKQKLTFEIGKRLESMILNLLTRAGISFAVGIKVKEKGYELFEGHLDALTWDDMGNYTVIEIKTAKDSSFNVFKNKGLRLWYPEYYDQIQSYMGMGGFKMACILALNKDTSELHHEMVTFDAERYQKLVEKAKRIGDARIVPPRINGSPSFFRCRICFYKGVCHDPESKGEI